MATRARKLKIAMHEEIETFRHGNTHPVAISDADTGDIIFIAHYPDEETADNAAELFAAALQGNVATTAKPLP
ncbi:hypothetical protein E4M02_04390 [Brevundimonas sp. S30B]|uniref:hypothetical protein n=1 Tax=unclassified Brevundimonas TaxID=2622653 RepID=UPI001071E6C2|nr:MULTISPECIES: hypothetical protein [Brevundimonas]QBX36890.1 hypothetical protein E4M01_03425 [Brevundimonas sp. MF30-B]TFW04315.1 hypothetical protein E4M02_04390 [Brevundimonas sp. S30B]